MPKEQCPALNLTGLPWPPDQPPPEELIKKVRQRMCGRVGGRAHVGACVRVCVRACVRAWAGLAEPRSSRSGKHLLVCRLCLCPTTHTHISSWCRAPDEESNGVESMRVKETMLCDCLHTHARTHTFL